MKCYSDCLPALVLLLSLALAPLASAADRADASRKFFASREVVRLKITLPPANVAALKRDHREYVQATVREGKTTYTNVALRLKGSRLGSFRSLDDKPALTLNFDKFVDDQNFHGLDKFYLNNSVEDPSYMAEALCSSLFRESNVPAPRVTFARIELNGIERGLYVLKEGFDKAFLKGWFKENDGNFYDGGSREDVTDPLKISSGDKKSDRHDLKALAAAARVTDPGKRWIELGTVLDRERFITFMALEVLTWHWDGYAMNKNNYRLYHDPKSDRMIFMPHGMDLMFEEADGAILPQFEGLVAKAVAGTEEGRNRYLARARELRSQFFTRELMTKRIDDLQAQIRPTLAAIHPKAAIANDRAVRMLRQRISDRIEFLQAELKQSGRDFGP